MMPAAQDPCAWYFGFLIAVHPLILAASPAAIEPLVFLAYPLQPVHLFLPEGNCLETPKKIKSEKHTGCK